MELDNRTVKNLAIEFSEVERLLIISFLTLWQEFELVGIRIILKDKYYILKNNASLVRLQLSASLRINSSLLWCIDSTK